MSPMIPAAKRLHKKGPTDTTSILSAGNEETETKEDLVAVQLMKKFMVARLELTSSIDMSIVGPSPIIQKVHFIGRFQLQIGKVQHGDT